VELAGSEFVFVLCWDGHGARSSKQQRALRSWGWRGCATTVSPSAYVDPVWRAAHVSYPAREATATVVVDADQHYLYLVQGAGKARRYGVGVGNEGARWAGIATVHNKQEWPDWYPTAEILQRHPELTPDLKWLPGGLGLPGGEDNPLGARALYLWQQNRDTLYRIHGTNEPWTIGKNVSSGCIRMFNDDVVDLYDRVAVGSKVIVLPSVIS
jgi:lipoprotein-anchoring transpeptidase ErfK/SrfK